MKETKTSTEEVMTWVVCTSFLYEKDTAPLLTFYRVAGTEAQVREYMLGRVHRDREADRGNWRYGTKTVESIDKDADGCLSAHSDFANYHIVYHAEPEPELKTLA